MAIGVIGSVVAHVVVVAGLLLLPMRNPPPSALTGPATITDATRGIPGGPAPRRKDERDQPPGVDATVAAAPAARRSPQPEPITTPSVLMTAVRLAGHGVRSDVVAPLESALPPSARRLVRHLWESTIFAAGVWVVTLLLRRRAVRVHYWLWMAASLKFLVPLSLSASDVNSAGVSDGSWTGRLAPIVIPVWLLGLVATLLVRHSDRLTPGLHKVTEAVFWFYPPVWWIGRCLTARR